MGQRYRLSGFVEFVISRCRGIRCAVTGVRYVVRSQRNAWVHVAATMVVLALSAVLRLSPAEWCWMIAAMAGVWSAESMNTALELLCDAACPEFHPMVGRAKDVAAGAVLVMAVAALAIAAVIVVPHVTAAT